MTGELYAQNNYGLIYQTKTSSGLTSFDATDGESMIIGESLSLDFKFSIYSHRSRFGYLAKLIFNNKTTLNVVVNNTKPGKQSLTVVSEGSLITDEPILCNENEAFEWNDVSININPQDSSIRVNINGSLTECKLPIAEQSDVRIIFGASNLEGFVVGDVPSIIIRDLELKCGKIHKLWRLQNHTDNVTLDEIKSARLVVQNPIWESDLHSSWILEREITRSSRIFPVYNGTNKIHVVGSGGVWDYNLELGRGVWRKFNTPISLGNSSNQFVFDEKSQRIRYFDSTSPGEFHSVLNNKTLEWEPVINRLSEASYQQSNLFISPINNELLQLFGYGFFRYKSTMFSTSMQGVTTSVEIDGIAPRYLASTAVVDDWCYVYGGIGNESGRQELGSYNLHDLHRIELNSGKAEKIWSIDKNIAEEVACQNMVIMPDNPDYGVSLFYDPSILATGLNLKAINLKEPEIVDLLHDPIPYNFVDIESHAQLIYVKSLSKLFAITVEKRGSEEYKMRIYSIAYPVIDVKRAEDSSSGAGMIVIIAIIIFISGGFVYYLKRKRRRVQRHAMPYVANHVDMGVDAPDRDINIVPRVRRTGVYLLDGFTIIDSEQIDITGEFAPLMKQLLSLIILYTQKNGKGVSNTVLKDVLWFDKSDSSARNNRSVTISKIRQSLQKVGGYQILFNNSYWRIEYTEGDFCDYAYACQTIDGIDGIEMGSRVDRLSEVAQMGDLLPNQMFDFFDGFKAEYASSVIDAMNRLLKSCDDQNYKITLANLILRFDKVDESATREKCLALIALGKNGLAKTTFDNFTREYATLFGEPFEDSFEEFVKE